MTSLTIELSAAQKQAIQVQASTSQKSLKDFILEKLGVEAHPFPKPKCGLEEAIEDMKNGRYTIYDSLEEWEKDTDKLWEEAKNES